MLNTTNVKSLSTDEGGVISLEEIATATDSKLSYDDLQGSNGISIDKTSSDKVEVKLNNNLTLGFPQIPSQGTTGSLNIRTYGGSKPTYISLNDSGISTRFGNTNSINIVDGGIKYVDSSGTSDVTYNFLREDNFSTLMSGGFNLGTTDKGLIKLSNSLDSQYNVYIEVSHPGTETIHIGYNDITWSKLTESAKYLRENNIKTINGESIYGSGDITISGGGKTYYRHLIKMGAELFVSTTKSIAIKFEIIDTRSTTYTSVQEIIQAHPSYKTLCAGGRINSSGEKVDTFAVYMELPATYGSNNIDFYSAADMWESSPTFSVEANFVDLAVTDTLEAL